MNLRNNAQGVREMVQWLRLLAIHPEGLDSVPNTNTVANNLLASQGTKHTDGVQTYMQAKHAYTADWRNGSIVKSTFCSSRGPRFDS